MVGLLVILFLNDVVLICLHTNGFKYSYCLYTVKLVLSIAI